MSQADQTVQNDTFPTVRADINNNLAALFSNSSGGTAPSVTVAHQDWVDTSGADPVWKKRNAANNGWITIGTIKTNTLEFASDNVLPSQTGNSGEFLTTDGTTASWAAIPPGSSVTTFTASDTWIKPSAGTMAYVEMWGGGEGGARSTTAADGGSGGGFRWSLIPLAALTATVSVTIGAGGTGRTATTGSGTAGGETSFGSYVSVRGGSSGGGGGWTSQGYIDVQGDDVDGLFGDAEASGTSLYVGTPGRSGSGGNSVYGGCAGGGATTTVGSSGGTSTFGGDGGAGSFTATGGVGTAPGGGGGAGVNQNGGDGARGEVRVYVW